MGTGSKVANVVLRFCELCSAVIVLGIACRFLHLLNEGNGPYSSRIVYATALSSIATAASIILMPPLIYTFYAFGFDLAMFIMWMTCFGLLVNLTGSDTCSSSWYYSYWGYYWGGWYYAYPSGWNTRLYWTSGCTSWRVLLAFAFIGGFTWLISFFLGLYAVAKHREDKKQIKRDSPATSTV